MDRPFGSSACPWATLALGCLLAVGCQSRTATVSGTVTYRGQPVTGGSVVFYCSDKQIVRGLIGPDGRYSIPNVPIGSASVVVAVQSHAKVPEGFRLSQQLPPSAGGPVPPAPTPPGARPVALPPRYALPEESGLAVTIGDAHVTYDIDLKP
ncbi:MAG TPA: carboxypeptidase-like regulatory domain-containing protein [Gemmata sp.]